MASAEFIPSNTHDKPLINPYHNLEADTHLTPMYDRKTRLTAEINANRGDNFILGF